MDRRSFLRTGVVGTAATAALAAPTLVRAQESFTWRMTNAYPPTAPFYVTGPGSPTDIIEKIQTMSGGRLTIQHFAAGELIPALEGFDAVVSGTVESNAANSYFWSGKSFAAQYFTTVPFGMSFLGHMSWLYHGGGIDLWHEVYEPFNVVAFPMNNTGVQMTGWFREPVESLEQLNGLRMRIPGLAGKVYGALGVDARVLPAPEIFPALERGVQVIAGLADEKGRAHPPLGNGLDGDRAQRLARGPREARHGRGSDRVGPRGRVARRGRRLPGRCEEAGRDP